MLHLLYVTVAPLVYLKCMLSVLPVVKRYSDLNLINASAHCCKSFSLVFNSISKKEFKTRTEENTLEGSIYSTLYKEFSSAEINSNGASSIRIKNNKFDNIRKLSSSN